MVDSWKREISRRQMLGTIAAGGAAVAMPGFLASCASAVTKSSKTLDTLNWATLAGPAAIDTRLADAHYEVCLSLGIEKLLGLTDDGHLVSLLAESWSQPDPLTYIYKLRSGVKFWDGTPMTAQDVVYSYNLQAGPMSNWGVFFASMDSITATGPLEVTIKLKSANQFFKYTPAITGQVISAAYAQAHPQDLGTPAVLNMATGAYKITAFTPGSSMTLARNEGYWGTKPPVKNVQISFIPDENTLLLAMRSGSIDGVFAIPTDELSQWQAIPGTKILSTAAERVDFISFNTTRPPFNDVHARHAVAYCLDKKGLVQAVLGGQGAVAPTMVMPELWASLLTPAEVTEFYNSLPQYGLDLAMARQELAMSATPNGFTITINNSNSRPTITPALISLKNNLSQIGITLNVNVIPNAQWLTEYDAHNSQIYASSFPGLYPDPNSMANFEWNSSGAKPLGQDESDYSNPEIDTLLNTQLSSADTATRVAALKQIVQTTSQDEPQLPMWYEKLVMAYNSKKFSYNGFSVWTYQGTNWINKLALV